MGPQSRGNAALIPGLEGIGVGHGVPQGWGDFGCTGGEPVPGTAALLPARAGGGTVRGDRARDAGRGTLVDTRLARRRLPAQAAASVLADDAVLCLPGR